MKVGGEVSAETRRRESGGDVGDAGGGVRSTLFDDSEVSREFQNTTTFTTVKDLK